MNSGIGILLILLGTIVLNYLLRSLVKLPKRLDTKRAKTLLSLTQSTISIAIFILGFILILSILEVDITPFLASAGIVGIAIGFGSQSLVKDLIAGLFLLAEDSIAVGDLVEIGGSRGLVQRISLRTVILKDEDGALHIVPAGQITKVTNLSRQDAQINIDLPINSASQIDKIYKILRQEIKDFSEDKRFEKLFTKKTELKGIEDIQAKKVIVRITFYSKSGNQWKIKREFLYRVKRRFETEAIEFA